MLLYYTPLVRQPKAIFPPNPKISDIVFSLLIIYHWHVYNDIWGGLDLSPMNIFNIQDGAQDGCHQC